MNPTSPIRLDHLIFAFLCGDVVTSLIAGLLEGAGHKSVQSERTRHGSRITDLLFHRRMFREVRFALLKEGAERFPGFLPAHSRGELLNFSFHSLLDLLA